MRNWDSCRCWRCTFCPCKVRNRFLVNFWNCTIHLWTHCILCRKQVTYSTNICVSTTKKNYIWSQLGHQLSQYKFLRFSWTAPNQRWDITSNHTMTTSFHILSNSWLLSDSATNCKKLKGKTVPLQAWSGPEGSRKLRFPDFMTAAQDGGKIVSLTHQPPLPPGNTPGTESTPGPQCDQTDYVTEKFQWNHRESNPRPANL